MSTPASSPLTTSGITPVRYDPSMEKLDKDEAETNQGLIDTITKIQHKVYADSHHATRGVHAKSHGVLMGEFRVLENLPAELAQGLFAQPGSYPVVMRFSTIPGDVLDDNVSVPRGLAIKVVGVPGARVSGSEGDVTQDFVFANGPVFPKGHPKGFLSTLKLLAGTTDKAPGLKKVLSSVMRGAEKLLESVGGESPTLMTLGGYPEINILGDDLYSQAPILYGDYMVKVAIKPFSAGLRALRKAKLDLKDKPNGIREAVVDFFRVNAGVWDLQVQLCTDLEAMPIEDASKLWPEDKSPYQSVARIFIAPQDAWSAARVKQVDEEMSFSPWHALAAHRPLGAIMRVRKTVYDTAARFRAEHNQVPVVEPKSADLPQ
jgi:catalase